MRIVTRLSGAGQATGWWRMTYCGLNNCRYSSAIYEQLGLKVTYLPGQDKLRADVTISPETFAPKGEQYGEMGRRVRGGT